MFSSKKKEKKQKQVSYGYVDAQHRALNVMNLSCPVHTCCECSPVLQAAPIAHFKSLQTPDSNKREVTGLDSVSGKGAVASILKNGKLAGNQTNV